MWFIKVDDEMTLENVCDAVGMEPKALFNPLHQNVLNIILRHPEDKSQTSNMVYTNITLSFEKINNFNYAQDKKTINFDEKNCILMTFKNLT